LRNIFTITFTTLHIFAVSVAFVLKPVSAGTPFFDKNCREYMRTAENIRRIPAANIAPAELYSSMFKANGQKYLLNVPLFQNGTAVFCLVQPDTVQWKNSYRQWKPLSNAQQIQFKFIDKIVKEPNKEATFLITVREGKGLNQPKTVYRLNLTNPNRSAIALVNRRSN
jgi:hypothetical protein